MSSADSYAQQVEDSELPYITAEWGQSRLTPITVLLHLLQKIKGLNPKRNNPNMDYSVGGPLWQEWQRLETHSEWDRWKDLYFHAPMNLVDYEKHRHSTMRFRAYFDWLLENEFVLEAEEVQSIIDYSKPTNTLPYPKWLSVSEDPNSEPVEGAA